MFGFITIAVAPLGEYCAPTPGEHLLDLVLERRVDRQLQRSCPGSVGRTSSIEIGCPIASLTTAATPSLPAQRVVVAILDPAEAASPQPTVPSTCEAAHERG